MLRPMLKTWLDDNLPAIVERLVAVEIEMAAIGRLAAANLNLSVARYDPAIHFYQVKDKWIGLRTPDGR
jgi:outer membrane protein